MTRTPAMTEAERERAAIVEWLRKESGGPRFSSIGREYEYWRAAAECIERLDHHKEDSKHG
ncbi:hypothetical protein CMI47_05655 [Candidatus Pacearchaeota archaeon]|nr:hypothetical protein [Candidatus Pacearchaeota archaeon]